MFFVIFWPQKLRSGECFDKYHVYPGALLRQTQAIFSLFHLHQEPIYSILEDEPNLVGYSDFGMVLVLFNFLTLQRNCSRFISNSISLSVWADFVQISRLSFKSWIEMSYQTSAQKIHLWNLVKYKCHCYGYSSFGNWNVKNTNIPIYQYLSEARV